VNVIGGAINANTQWICINDLGGTLNTTKINFALVPADTTPAVRGVDSLRASVDMRPAIQAAIDSLIRYNYGRDYWQVRSQTANFSLTAADASSLIHVRPSNPSVAIAITLGTFSHSAFGSSKRPSARKMRAARDLFVARMPDVPADGDIQGDAALDEDLRHTLLPDSSLSGSANLLILPTLDAANILFNVLKVTGGAGVTVGPILPGVDAPAHILTPSATVRRVVNMTALVVADASVRAMRGM
jgi:Phosphate acetyl/butaryl transferase